MINLNSTVRPYILGLLCTLAGGITLQAKDQSIRIVGQNVIISGTYDPLLVKVNDLTIIEKDLPIRAIKINTILVAKTKKNPNAFQISLPASDLIITVLEKVSGKWQTYPRKLPKLGPVTVANQQINFYPGDFTQLRINDQILEPVNGKRTWPFTKLRRKLFRLVDITITNKDYQPKGYHILFQNARFNLVSWEIAQINSFQFTEPAFSGSFQANWSPLFHVSNFLSFRFRLAFSAMNRAESYEMIYNISYMPMLNVAHFYPWSFEIGLGMQTWLGYYSKVLLGTQANYALANPLFSLIDRITVGFYTYFSQDQLTYQLSWGIGYGD